MVLGLIMLSCSSGETKKGSKNNSNENEKIYLPGINGVLGEIVVIVEDGLWKAGVDKAIETALQVPYSGIPQEEHSFNVVRLTESTFSKLLKQHRNILRTKIDKNLSKPIVEYNYNKWAKGQLIIDISAASVKGLSDIIVEKKAEITIRLTNIERKRVAKDFAEFQNKRNKKILRKKHGLNMVVPQIYQVLENRKTFTWFSYEPRKIQKGVMVYSTPYNADYIKTFGSDMLNKKYLMHIKDSVLKKNVPGAKPNTYMAIERSFDPIVSNVTINGRVYTEMRGLWRVNGLVMGGPFVSVSTIDKKRNEVLTINSYVYCPHYAKRNHVMQVESLLYSAKIK